MIFGRMSLHKIQTSLVLLIFIFVGLGYLLLAIGVHTRMDHVESELPARQGRDLLTSDPVVNIVTSPKSTSKKHVVYTPDQLQVLDVQKLIPKQANHIDVYKSLLGKDPEKTLARMRQIDAKSQDIYIRALKNKNQLIEAEDGSVQIYSNPYARVISPTSIKTKKVQDWNEREKIWINLTHFPWPDDEECNDLTITFDRSLKSESKAIASYPGSGNTWMRYLIEGSTGIFTGSMYSDLSLRREGLYGEGVAFDSGLTAFIKTHGFTTGPCLHKPREEQIECNHFEELHRKGILLIRNPFKAIISHRNLDSGGHKGFANLDEFVGEGWDHFVQVKAEAWKNFYLDWLNEAKARDLLVIHFEEIRPRFKEVLSQIVSFHGNPVADVSRRLSCVVNNSEGKFHRKEKKDSVELHDDPFTKKHKEIIKEAIKEVDELLQAKGFRQLPVDKYEYFW